MKYAHGRVRVLRLSLLLVLMCMFLGLGWLRTAGVAHAAPSQAAYSIGRNCPSGMAEMDDAYQGVICFGYGYGLPVNDITALNTGGYTVSWEWEDCNGGEHFSEKGPGTLLYPGQGITNWGGCSAIDEVSYVSLTKPGVTWTYHAGENCPYGTVEMDNYDEDVGCFINGGGTAVYGISIVNTGLHTLYWQWQDCNTPTGYHSSQKGPGTMLYPGQGITDWAGCPYMVAVTYINVT